MNGVWQSSFWLEGVYKPPKFWVWILSLETSNGGATWYREWQRSGALNGGAGTLNGDAAID